MPVSIPRINRRYALAVSSADSITFEDARGRVVGTASLSGPCRDRLLSGRPLGSRVPFEQTAHVYLCRGRERIEISAEPGETSDGALRTLIRAVPPRW